MKFFAVPFFGDMAGSVASLFSGSGSSSTGWSQSQYRDYGDSAYRMHRDGYMDRDLAARMMGMGYASEYRGDLDNYYRDQGYDRSLLQEAQFFGDEYRRSPGAYDGAYFNRLASHHNVSSYRYGGGRMDCDLLPYYDNHIRPGYARSGMGIDDGLLSGLNFGDGGGDMLSFLSNMGSRGFPSIGGLGGLGDMIPDCGFGGSSDRGHGLGGLANLGGLGNIGRLFS